MGGNIDEIVIAPEAFAVMAIHSLSHLGTEVHGVLLGSMNGSKVDVSLVYPICHETPTRPLIDAALAVCMASLEEDSSNSLVGWYTIPVTFRDGQPSGAVHRILAGLEGVIADPVLVTGSQLSTAMLASKPEASKTELVHAFGKDFGGQYKGKLKATITSELKVVKRLRGFTDQEFVCDLVDHWSSPNTEWPSPTKMSIHF
jgi:Uncharacterised protein family (UPF0172)